MHLEFYVLFISSIYICDIYMRYIYMSHAVVFTDQPRPVTGQNGRGQNGTDKMVWTKWYTDKMIRDKMVWTKWYGQNGTDKMVAIFGIHYNSSEFNSYFY